MTVSQWMDICFDSYKHSWKVSSVKHKHREQIVRNHIKPLIGHYKLSKLDKTTYIKEFIHELLKTQNLIQYR